MLEWIIYNIIGVISIIPYTVLWGIGWRDIVNAVITVNILVFALYLLGS